MLQSDIFLCCMLCVCLVVGWFTTSYILLGDIKQLRNSAELNRIHAVNAEHRANIAEIDRDYWQAKYDMVVAQTRVNSCEVKSAVVINTGSCK